MSLDVAVWTYSEKDDPLLDECGGTEAANIGVLIPFPIKSSASLADVKGEAADVHPNLSWMGLKDSGNEFTAMITAVRAWAETQNGWDHPLASIKEALLEKASGRVFQTDTPFAKMKPTENAGDRDWNDFNSRTREHRLFFDYEFRE